jgi:hypothetical protein
MIKTARIKKMSQQIDECISETDLDDDHISEGDLIDFALTCRVEKDYDPAYTENDYDTWWDYYFELDTDREDEVEQPECQDNLVNLIVNPPVEFSVGEG